MEALRLEAFLKESLFFLNHSLLQIRLKYTKGMYDGVGISDQEPSGRLRRMM